MSSVLSIISVLNVMIMMMVIEIIIIALKAHLKVLWTASSNQSILKESALNMHWKD